MVGVPFVECLANMGSVNPVFERAGMERIGQCAVPAGRERLWRELRRLKVDPLGTDLVDQVKRRPVVGRLARRVIADWLRATTAGGERRSVGAAAASIRGARYVVIVVDGSDLASGHPERVDFEANYTWLVWRILAAGSAAICVTLPPCSHLEPFAWIYNTVIYQAARLNRVPLIDVHELMRGHGPAPVNNEPGVGKVPPVDWVKRNRFVPGHEQFVAAKLEEIVRKMEGE